MGWDTDSAFLTSSGGAQAVGSKITTAQGKVLGSEKVR